nr:helix-turn-helix transcriptional regulator [uncultured Brevundimonas sp.]
MTADDFDVELGTRVKARRLAVRVTQAELAQQIGVTFQQVQKYERGQNRISASMLARIAAVLDTTASELMGETFEAGDPDARAVLVAWAKLTPDQRQAMLTLARTITR